MAWVYLFIAGLLEIVWATSLKLSDGFTRFWPSVATIVFTTLSFIMLAIAMKSLPLGTAYSVWTGIGVVGSLLVGILFLGESSDPLRLFFVALILIGIVGLRVAGSN